MHNWLFYTLLSVVLLEFILKQWLAYLNRQAASAELPDAVKDIYDTDEYARQQAYFQTSNRFELISSSFSLLLIVGMLLTGGFGWWYQQIETLQWSLMATTLLFFGSLYLAYKSLTLPLEIYRTFSIEIPFGVTQVSPRKFAIETLKSCGLTIFLWTALLCITVALYQWIGDWFGIGVLNVILLSKSLLSRLYLDYTMPLFNKLVPLEEGELRRAIEQLCDQSGFTPYNIYVMNQSDINTKAYICFRGHGSKNRIVIYDNLIPTLTTEEIVALLAHEIERCNPEKGLKGSQTGAFLTAILFLLLPIFAANLELAQALGAEHSSLAFAVIAFCLFYRPIQIIANLDFSGRLHKHIFQIDASVAAIGLGEPLISALKKLTAKSLGNLTPYPAYVKMFYLHPTLLQRINRLMQPE